MQHLNQEEGKPLLIEGVVREIDPLFDPVLEKNTMTRGRSFYIILGDKEVTMDKAFRLYLVTKLPNPKFSPEFSAKTTIIDFSVTQKVLPRHQLTTLFQLPLTDFVVHIAMSCLRAWRTSC